MMRAELIPCCCSSHIFSQAVRIFQKFCLFHCRVVCLCFNGCCVAVLRVHSILRTVEQLLCFLKNKWWITVILCSFLSRCSSQDSRVLANRTFGILFTQAYFSSSSFRMLKRFALEYRVDVRFSPGKRSLFSHLDERRRRLERH